jgi:nucleoside-triphosphatase THEP1
MIQIIIKGKAKYGRTKAEIAENLRKDGLPVEGLYHSEAEEDRGRWLDKKLNLRKLDENDARRIKNGE